MTRKSLKITLLTDVVITANSATQGEHETLDYIPGSLLRGAAIAKIGGSFKPELFFSGKVRFHNAYPVDDGQTSLPTPISFHTPKADNTQIYNGAYELPQEQTEQMRKNYINSNHIVFVNKAYHMKTAIDREKGIAMENQLFGYESINSGTTFGSFVDFDNDVKDEDIRKIINALSGEIHLGKSRSAEYGLANIVVSNDPQDYKQGQPATNKTFLYLASDLCIEENGIYVTKLKAEHLGFDSNITIDWEHSFVKTRKYSPWNAFWKGRMRERQVICKGSVITLNSSVNAIALKTKFDKGIGLYREEGLGRVLVNPDFLCTRRPQLTPQNGHNNIDLMGLPNIPQSATADTNLISLLRKKSNGNTISQTSITQGTIWVNTIYRNWYNIWPGKCPNASQWHNVRNLCAEFQTQGANTQLSDQLNQLCSEGSESIQWINPDMQYYVGNEHLTLLEYLEQEINELHNDELAAKALFFTAKEISKKIGSTGSN